MLVLEMTVPIGEEDDRSEICGRLVAWMIRMSMDTQVPLMIKVKDDTDENPVVVAETEQPQVRST